MKLLESLGYEVFRMAASKSVFDVIAVSEMFTMAHKEELLPIVKEI